MAKNKTINMVKSQVIYKDYSKDAERTALVSGENLAHMFGKIARWYTDISWVGHTHTEANITDFGTYAGASTKGGAATSANKLNIGASDIGSEIKPVYFSYLTGKPVACTYSLNASVPANAVFTDINVKQSPSTANESREVLFAGNTGNTDTTGTVGKSNKLYFNPSTGALTATSFSGTVNASNLSGTIDAGRLPTTAVTAGSYGPAAGGTLAHGGTFDVAYVTVDKYGRLTAASTKTFTLPAQYVHPTYTSKTSGLYKITVDGTGHVSGTAAVTAADLPSHSHALSLAADTGTSSITLSANTKYKLTAGGSTYVFTTPADTDTTYAIATGDSNGQIKVTPSSGSAYNVSVKGLGSAAYANTSDFASASHTHEYLPLSGGTLTGILTIKTSAFEKVQIYRSGSSNNAAIHFYNDSNSVTKNCLGSIAMGGNPNGGLIRYSGDGSTSWKILDTSNTSITRVLASGTKIATIKINGTSTDLFCEANTNTTYTFATGDSNGQIKVTPSSGDAYNVSVKGLGSAAYTASTNYAAASHTHKYAGSSSAGGAATSANKLNIGSSDIGNTITPVYFDSETGLPVVLSYTIETSVPADAVFTDTVYTHPTYTSKSSGLYKITVDSTGHVSAAVAVTGTDLPSHSHNLSMASSTGTPQISLAANTKYQLTAGGSTYIFTTPADTNTTYSVSSGDSNGQIKITPSSGDAYNVSVKGLGSAAYTNSSAYATSGHNHTLNIAASSGTSQISLSPNTKYQLTAGGSTYIFTTPADTNTTYTFATGDSNGQIKVTPSGGTAQNISVKGLGSAAYTASTAYAAASHTHNYVPNTQAGMIAGINLLEEATATPVDDCWYISQENDTTTTNFYKRKHSALWSYINGKISHSNTGNGNAVTSISYSNGVITATKGSTFSLSTHTHSYAKSSSVNGPAYSVEGWEGTDAQYRHIWFSTSTDETRRAYTDKFMIDPLNGSIKFISWVPIDITGVTQDLNNYNDVDGNFGYRRYICKTTGGGNNISNKPVNSPFALEVILIRWASTTDYITKQIYHAFNKKTYQRFCTNGTWSSWTEQKYRDTVYTHPSYTSKSSGLYKITVDSTGHISATAAVTASDLPSHTHSYLPLAGGTMSGLIVGGRGYTHLALGTDSYTNDYGGLDKLNNVDINTWYGFSVSNACTTVGTLNQVAFSVNARTGNVYARTGIYVGSTKVSLEGHTHTYLIDPGDSSYKIEVSWAGDSVPTTETCYPAVFTSYNKSSGMTIRVKETTWTNVKSFLGLGSAAYTNSTAYAAASHTHSYLPLAGGTLTGYLKLGYKNDSTIPTTGIYVNDLRNVNIPASGIGGHLVNFYFHMADSPDTSRWWSIMHVKGWEGAYCAWELAGTAHNTDDRTRPLYVRCSNANTAWGSWRKIYDSSNKPTLRELGAASSSHTHKYLIDPGESSYKIELAWKGDSVPTTETTYPAVFTLYNMTSGMTIRVKETTWTNVKSFLGLGSAAYTASTAYAAASHTHTYIESKANYTFTSSTLPNSFDWGVSAGFVKDNAGYGSYGSVLTVRTYSGGGGSFQLYAPYSPTYGGTRLKARFGNYDSSSGNSWTSLKEIAWHDEKLGAKTANGYCGMTDTSGADNVWIRTTSLGIIPYQSGAAGSGHQTIGTSSWYFSAAYIDTVYGQLSGDITTTVTDPSSNTSYGLVFVVDPGTSEINTLRKSYDARLNHFRGAANTEGLAELVLGNNVASTAANNSTGQLSLYNSKGACTDIRPNTNTSTITITLPSSTGTLALVGDNNHTHNYVPNTRAGMIAGINLLDTATAAPTDDSYYIAQENNASTTNYYRRKHSAIWSYIKGKADSVYAAASHSHSYLPLSGGDLTGNVSLAESKSILLRPNHSSYTAGIGYDTSGNECIALWAKNTVTRLRWYAGTDMTTMTSGTMMGITPDFEISKASGSASGYIGGDAIIIATETSVSQAINNLSIGTSTPSDNDYYVAQYANGGTSVTSYHRRLHSALFSYINGKLYKILWSGSTSCAARSSTSITLTTAIAANTYRFIKIVWTVSGGTGVSEIRADTLNVTNNVSSASGATTANIIQFTISSDGKKLTVGPGTTAITVLQIAGVHPL